MTDTPKYIVHDVKKIQSDMGDHEVTEQTFVLCPVCDKRHYQRHNECGDCGVSVVWKNSTIWRDLWGNANTAIRRLNRIAATDPAGIELMKVARQSGFVNQGEYDRWAKALRKLGPQAMMDKVNYVCSKGMYGRPLIAYALNLVEKVARETKKPAKVTVRKPRKKKGKVLT